MLDRNRRIKPKPERFQECSEHFDVIITCEERVYDQVIEGSYMMLYCLCENETQGGLESEVTVVIAYKMQEINLHFFEVKISKISSLFIYLPMYFLVSAKIQINWGFGAF